jgi:hypothetical protein
MARIKLSGLSSDISGSIGGFTFQNSRSGTVMKIKPKGFHGGSEKRSVSTSIMLSLQSSWMSLSDSERQMWNNFSIFKKVSMINNPGRYLNGHELFIKYNVYRLLTGRALQTNCLYGFSELDPLTVTLSLAGANMFITGSRLFDASVEFLVLMCTYPCASSVLNPGSRFRYIPFTYVSSGSIFITSGYTQVFGRAAESGEFIHYRYRLVDLIGLYVHPWQYSSVLLP